VTDIYVDMDTDNGQREPLSTLDYGAIFNAG
jgi:hypothetical protein